MIYVGIDLGTYLCRFILAENGNKKPTKNGKAGTIAGQEQTSIEDRFNVLSYNTCVVNFGNMEPGKAITKQTIYRIERIFEKFKKYIDEHKGKKIVIKCVATAALRYSPSAQEIIERVERKYKIKIEVIAPEHEIYLAALGCQDQIDNKAIVLDIGSGSTEIAYVTKNNNHIEVHDYISLDLGLINNGTTKEKRNQTLAELDTFIKKYKNIRIICSKCNTLKIAYNYFHKKRDGSVEGQKFGLAELSKVVQIFNKMDTNALKKVPNIGAKKMRLIKCGLPWVHLIFKRIGIEHIILSEYGLKEGIILDMMNKTQHVSVNESADKKIDMKQPAKKKRPWFLKRLAEKRKKQAQANQRGQDK